MELFKIAISMYLEPCHILSLRDMLCYISVHYKVLVRTITPHNEDAGLSIHYMFTTRKQHV